VCVPVRQSPHERCRRACVCRKTETRKIDRQTDRRHTLAKEINTYLSALVGFARTFLGRCIHILQCISCHRTVDTKRRVNDPRDPRLEETGHTTCDCKDKNRSAGKRNAVVGVRDDGRGKGRHQPRERCTGRSLVPDAPSPSLVAAASPAFSSSSLAPLASSPALAMSPFPSSLDLAFSSSGIITPQFTLYALARMHAFKPGKATGREAYLHFPLHPPCPRLHRLLPLGNPCSAPHSPRLHPRPSLLPAKHFQVSRDRRQRTCAPHANQRTHQHLSATATEMKPSACTRTDALTLFLTLWRRASSSHLLFVVILL